MGLIFGPDGFIRKIGKTTYINSKAGGDTINEVGGEKYDSHGGRMSRLGDMSCLSNGETINKIGNTYYCGTKSYYLIGNVLNSSDGKT